PQPLEIVINDVHLEGLIKQVPDIIQQHKTDEEGNLLYLLPQEPLEVVEQIPKTIETTETTDDPVMIKKPYRVPVLNENGVQKQYEQTVRGETTEVTDEPIMEKVWDEVNELYNDVQKVDEDGNPLYWGLVGTGRMIDIFTTEEVEEQKTDDNGELLFYQEITEPHITYEDQEPLEITEEHESWTDQLTPALEDINQVKTIKFEDQPSLFTHDDIVNAPKVPPSEIETLQEDNLMIMEAAADIYEQNLQTQDELLNTMDALATVYEQVLILQGG
ncbi:hypothetical protein Q5Y73_14210, partial [Chengkuizengella sp. 2205SS18-9]